MGKNVPTLKKNSASDLIRVGAASIGQSSSTSTPKTYGKKNTNNPIDEETYQKAKAKGISDEKLFQIQHSYDIEDMQNEFENYYPLRETAISRGDMTMGAESPDQKKADDELNRILNKYGVSNEEFHQYYDKYSKDRTNKELSESYKRDEEYAKAHPIKGSLKSVGLKVAEPVEGYVNLLKSIQSTQLDPNSDFVVSNSANSTREGVKQNIKSKPLQYAYDIGMGGLDMLGQMGIGVLTGGGSTVTGAMQGLSAANNMMQNSSSKGNSALQTSVEGLLGGGVGYLMGKGGMDALTEKIVPKNALLKAVSNNLSKSTLGNLAKGAAIEGTEEVVENVLDSGINQVASAALGGTSNKQSSVDYYLSQGMSQEEAEAQYRKDRALEIAQAGGSGAIAGGLFKGALGAKSKFDRSRVDAGKTNSAVYDMLNGKPTESVQNLEGLPEPEVTPTKEVPRVNRNANINNDSSVAASDKRLVVPLEEQTRIPKLNENVNNNANTTGIEKGIANNAEEYIQKISNDINQPNTGTVDTANAQDAVEIPDENMLYHSGILSKLNKAESRGKMSEPSRGTGYYGTGHYFVDSAHRSELTGDSAYNTKPYSSVDVTKAGNLYRADTDQKAMDLHRFSEDYTRSITGKKELSSEDLSELFNDYNKLFPESPMTIDEFAQELGEYRASEDGVRLDTRGDSIFTLFMKRRGYNGVDTRGTNAADTRYGTVIYDLPEDAVLQSNVTDADARNGKMNTRVREDGKSVFDAETDAQIQKQLDIQARRQEVAQEYRKIYDDTNLKKLQSEIDDLTETRKTKEKALEHYENIINNPEYADQELRRTYKEIAEFMGEDFDLEAEVEAARERNLADARQSAEDLKKQISDIDESSKQLTSEVGKEEAASKAAYDRAVKTVKNKDLAPTEEVYEDAPKRERNRGIKKKANENVEPDIPLFTTEAEVPTVEKTKNGQRRTSSAKETFEHSTDEATLREVYGDNFDYKSRSEDVSLRNGLRKVKNDINGTVERITRNSSNIESDSDVDAAFIAKSTLEKQRAEAKLNGDTDTVNRLTQTLRELKSSILEAGREHGRAINAFKKWARNEFESIEIAAYNIMDERVEKAVRKNPKIKKNVDKAIERLETAVGKMDLGENPEKYRKSIEKNLQTVLGDKADDLLVKRITDSIIANKKLDSNKIRKYLTQYEATGKADISDETLEQVEKIYEEMKKHDINSKEHVELETKAYALIANDVCEASFWDKWNAWRYLAMLSKPSTHIRNMMGNVAMGGLENISDRMSAVIENLVLEEADRTKVAGKLDEKLVEAARKDANNKSYRALKDSKYEKGTTEGAIEQNKRVFDNKYIEGASQLNSKLLEDEDTMAATKIYTRAQAGYLQAKGYDASVFDLDEQYNQLQKELGNTEAMISAAKAKGQAVDEYVAKQKSLTEQIDGLQEVHDLVEASREYAVNKAKVGTFHEDSRTANTLTNISREKMNSDRVRDKALGMLIEGIVPFKKTPINILKQGVRYSPVNVLRSLAEGVLDVSKNGKVSTKAIEDMSKGISGSTLMLLGFMASKMGIVKANKNTKSEEASNVKDYSLNLGGYSIPIDFLAPAALPLLVGAEANEIREKKANGGDIGFTDYLNAMMSIADPLVETTMLQGLNDVFKSISYAARNEESKGAEGTIAVTKALTGYVGQGVPGLVGGIAKTVDPYSRSTRTKTDGPIGTIERAAVQAKNKIPFVSMLSPKNYDAWGRPYKNGETLIGRGVSNIVAPTKAYKTTVEPIDKKVQELEKAGFENAMPKKPDASISIKGEDGTSSSVRLTPEEYARAQEAGGTFDRETASKLIDMPEFQALSQEQQANALNAVYNIGKVIGNKAAKSEYTSDSTMYGIYEKNGESKLDDTLKYICQDQVISTRLGEIEKETGVKVDKPKYRDLYNESPEKAEEYAQEAIYKAGLKGEVLKGNTEDTDLTVSNTKDYLKNSDMSDSEKGKAIQAVSDSKAVKEASQYGDDKVWYLSSTQEAYKKAYGGKKENTGKAQKAASNYINSLNVSNEVKGMLWYNGVSDSSQYETVYNKGGYAAVWQLHGYKMAADSNNDGKVTKDEAMDFIDSHYEISGYDYFPLIISSKANNPYVK